MGAQNTKAEEPLADHLTSEEVTNLKKLFNTFHTQIAAVGQKGEKTLCSSFKDFQAHCESHLTPWLATRVAEKLAVSGKEGTLIPLPSYLSFVSHLLKGTLEEKVDLIWNLVTPPSPANASPTVQDLLQYTNALIESYLKCLQESPVYRSWLEAEIVHHLTPDSLNDLAELLLQDVLYPGVPDKDIIRQEAPSKTTFAKEDLLHAFSRSPLLQQLHSSVAAVSFSLDVDHHFTRLLPRCVNAQKAFLPTNFSLLDPARILFLNSQLPPELRCTWRFLFSNSAHGESFAKLLGLIEGKGPTLLIIKEEGGRTFGAFNTQSWKLGPKFFGDRESFLFHLSPKFALYSSTGYNDNFQYLNLQQQTLPNGMGIGGQLNYFGIWIDGAYGKGKASPSCTTYSSPQMSSEQEFTIVHLEAWGVGPEPRKEEEGERSILDGDPATKALLELVDRGVLSDKLGLRDERNDGPLD